MAFARAGVPDWERYVRQCPRYFRLAGGGRAGGDASKAREVLGWAPKVGFEESVGMMVDADLAAETDVARQREVPIGNVAMPVAYPASDRAASA